MGGTLRNKAVIFLLLVISLAVCYLIWTSSYYLEIRSRSNLVAWFSMEPGNKIELEYTHSWDGTQVYESFYIREDKMLILASTEYEWLGTGLEHNPPKGEVYHTSSGTTRIENINREMETLPLRVGTVATHVLFINDEEVVLTDIVAPGEPIVLRIRRGLFPLEWS